MSLVVASVGFLVVAHPAHAAEGITLSAEQVPMEMRDALEHDGVIVVSDEPLAGELVGVVAPLGADCSGWYEPCGIVYNRSGRTLELRRDAASHFNCKPVDNDRRRSLSSGQDSNKIGSPTWPDVDCIRHNTSGCTIFYRGLFYSSGSWIRIYNSVWVYNLNC